HLQVLPLSFDVRRRAWFDSYVTTILGRDVRELANVAGLRELPRLLQLAATRAANLLNIADLSREAAMPQTTLQRYWSLFENTFLLRSLPAWSANLGTRLVKTPKIMFGDTGLLCHLLGLNDARLQADALMTGAVLENFVGNELTKQLGWSTVRPSVFHFRSHTQQEVDFVLEDKAGRLVGIEVKKTASPGARDFKGLHYFAELTGKRFLRGILLYCGTTTVPVAPNIHAVPMSALWRVKATG
ncbi:MAG: ATP-binding protein, partial [Roseimicrobium sp.]